MVVGAVPHRSNDPATPFRTALRSPRGRCPCGRDDEHRTARLVKERARDVEADLIVVGTHGRGGFRSAVLGSVARGLLHRAFCPVLSIPPETRVPALS